MAATLLEAVLALVWAHCCGLKKNDLGLCRPRPGSGKSIAAAAGLWLLLAWATSQFFPQEQSGAYSFAGMLYLCAVGPLIEELTFRGAVQGCLRPICGQWAVVGQAVLFAVLHETPQARVYALLAGSIFGWATETCGSVVPAVLLHMLNNSLLLVKGGRR